MQAIVGASKEPLSPVILACLPSVSLSWPVFLWFAYNFNAAFVANDRPHSHRSTPIFLLGIPICAANRLAESSLGMRASDSSKLACTKSYIMPLQASLDWAGLAARLTDWLTGRRSKQQRAPFALAKQSTATRPELPVSVYSFSLLLLLPSALQRIIWCRLLFATAHCIRAALISLHPSPVFVVQLLFARSKSNVERGTTLPANVVVPTKIRDILSANLHEEENTK